MAIVRFANNHDRVPTPRAVHLEAEVRRILEGLRPPGEIWDVTHREPAADVSWELTFECKGDVCTLRLEREDADADSPTLTDAITLFVKTNWR